MTVYPEWIKVACPTCKAKPYELCTATLTLPKGVTLRHSHGARQIAYDETQTTRTKDEKTGDSGKVLSSDSTSDRCEPNSDTGRRDYN